MDKATATAYKRLVYSLMAYRVFGEQLREWREHAGLSQVELADVLGVTQQTVSDWERGKARPAGSRALDLDAALKLEPQTVLHALYAEEQHDTTESASDAERQPAALSGKIGQLSDDDRRYVEGLVDRLLSQRKD